VKIKHFPETDMLYIELRPGAGADADEVAPGIVLDYDTDKNVIGIELDHATERTRLSKSELATFLAAVPQS